MADDLPIGVGVVPPVHVWDMAAAIVQNHGDGAVAQAQEYAADAEQRFPHLPLIQEYTKNVLAAVIELRRPARADEALN